MKAKRCASPKTYLGEGEGESGAESEAEAEAEAEAGFAMKTYDSTRRPAIAFHPAASIVTNVSIV